MLYQPEIQNAIDSSLDLLKRTCRSDNGTGKYGWYHYLDDPGAGVTASAVALFCFNLADHHFEETDKVLSYLKSKQVISDDKLFHGGWPIRTTTDFPIVESTAWIVRTLSMCKVYFNSRAPDLEAGYRWIINNQNEDHGWGSYKGHASRTFLTSLALLALASVNKFSKELYLGREWLLNHRHSGVPAWGAVPGSPPTILHTSFALLSLHEVPNGISQSDLTASLEWLEQNLDTRNMTEQLTQAEEYDVPYVTSGMSLVFQNSLPHFCLPIAAYTLLKLSNTPISPHTVQAIKYILAEQQKEGHWVIQRNPSRPSIWALWPFLATLTECLRVTGMKPNTKVTHIEKTVLIQPLTETHNPLFIIVKQNLGLLAHKLRSNFGWLILVLFVLGGALLVQSKIFSWFSWEQFLLSLLFPIILLILQYVLDGKK
ncbi:MAG: terpene cyclase/mutase family protein [Deltaproteobacteria bacterium]|nr:terpene cyclase/mutase family protein [Deltaproteobacteria bacterium]